jgi:hypothetical protein
VRVTPRFGELEVVLASSEPKTRPRAIVVDRTGRVIERRDPLPVDRPAPSTTTQMLVTITDDGLPIPPPGESRMAFERPFLHRTVGGKPFGKPLALTDHDKPITGLESIFTYYAWSGTHVLYPFWKTFERPPYYIEAHWFLLPIDCRP